MLAARPSASSQPCSSFSTLPLRRAFKYLTYFPKASHCSWNEIYVFFTSCTVFLQLPPLLCAFMPWHSSLPHYASATLASPAVLAWHQTLPHYLRLCYPAPYPVVGILVHVVYWGKDLRTKLQESEESKTWNGRKPIKHVHWISTGDSLGSSWWTPRPTWGKRPASYTTLSISHWLCALLSREDIISGILFWLRATAVVSR